MKAFLAFLLLFAGDDDTRLKAAKDAYRQGRFTEAVDQLEPILKRASDAGSIATEARALAANALHRRGEDRFRRVKVADSVKDFDREIELSPDSEPDHWQRGIAYYYAGEYEKGVRQFESHQTVNPQDVENAVWHFLCAVRSPNGSVASARKNLIRISRDTRVPMKQVHELFAGMTTPEEVQKAAADAGLAARFYADLYVGLYLEAHGKPEESRKYIQQAAENPAAKNNYMGDVARVHLKLRSK